MRLLQIHEYLALLEPGGAKALTDPPEDLLQASGNYAIQVWDSLGLKPFGEERKIEYIAQTPAGERLVHVMADHADAFVIVVWKGERIEGHMLFDIGAEYRAPTLVCPALELETEATREEIQRVVPALAALEHQENRFAILDLGQGTYMQTAFEDDGYLLEHQLVSVACHYTTPERLSAEEVTKAFESYAFGKKEWAHELTWEHQDLRPT